MLMNLQETTTKTYHDNYKTYCENTPSIVGDLTKEWIQKFLELQIPNPKVFELGSTGGRDAKYLKSLGAEVFCTDIISESVEDLKSWGFKSDFYNFRDELKAEWLGKFDGVFANAVLLHATKGEILDILSRLSRLLRSDGLIALSLKQGEGEEFTHDKIPTGRFFSYYTLESFKAFVPTNLELVFGKTTQDKKWLQIILKAN
jgi:SAM-dependent methyltransferase